MDFEPEPQPRPVYQPAPEPVAPVVSEPTPQAPQGIPAHKELSRPSLTERIRGLFGSMFD
ncbi:cell division protein FtsA C-terminal domain-containing protein [Streptococcus alactolyticus]|uniref:cell division protein FtsA C-terminal domain-containing protein n=1 Tax=Streptococcus alactolyticus TaxID=29389 RepID=UPI003B8A886F